MDSAVLAVVVALAAVQAATTATAVDAPTSAVWAPLDILLVSVLLRFVFSRAGLGPSIRLPPPAPSWPACTTASPQTPASGCCR